MKVGTYIKKNRMTTGGSNRGKDFISPYFKEVNRSYLYIVERVSHIEFDTYKQEYTGVIEYEKMVQDLGRKK